MSDEKVDINKIHISTPKLKSIPPRESELQKEREFNEKLSKEDKTNFMVCCDNTRQVILGAIKLGISKQELNILKEALHKHPLDGFGWNKHRNKETKEIDLDSLINEVFEIADFFKSENIKPYFLKEFYNLVQEQNTHSDWTITLERFNKKWKHKILMDNNSKNKFLEEGSLEANFMGNYINLSNANIDSKSNITITGGNQVSSLKNVESSKEAKKNSLSKWLIPIIVTILGGIIVLLFEYGIIQEFFK